MVSLIVSENSSFTNSVLAEFYRKTKVLQLRKSIVQTFKNLCFSINKDSKVLINNADAIAGDTDDVNFSLFSPLFKKYLNLAKETYAEKGIESYFSELISDVIHNYLDNKPNSMLSKDTNLCFVDFTNKEELTNIEKLLSSFGTVKNANDLKNTFEKLHFLAPFKNFVTTNESVTRELKCSLDGNGHTVRDQSEHLYSRARNLKHIPYIKILILSENAKFKLDPSLIEKSEYDLVIKDTDNIDETVIKMTSIFIQKSILQTYYLKNLNYYAHRASDHKDSKDKVTNSIGSMLLNCPSSTTQPNVSDESTTIELKDAQNYITYHDEIITELIQQCRTPEENKIIAGKAELKFREMANTLEHRLREVGGEMQDLTI